MARDKVRRTRNRDASMARQDGTPSRTATATIVRITSVTIIEGDTDTVPQTKSDTAGPIALTAVYTTNLLAPPAAGAGGVGFTATADRLYVRKIRLINVTAAAHTARIYKGATGANAAGTEIVPLNVSVPANDYLEFPFQDMILEGANGFLVGGADGAAALNFACEFSIGKV